MECDAPRCARGTLIRIVHPSATALATPLPTFDTETRTPFTPRNEAEAYLAELLTHAVPALRAHELEIVSVARRPGVLSKVGVRGPQPSIGADHIARVREQLDGERVEIVPWHPDQRRYITAALGLEHQPAMVLFPSIKHARVFLGEVDLRGIAGWRNINVVLASGLTGWRIRLLPIAETGAWRRLQLAQQTGTALLASVVQPGRVELLGLGLYATLRRRTPDPGEEIWVRVQRLDPDEGRIVVSDRLGPTGQLRLPLVG
jgi:transcription antitermination factor NusA-like protein